ncbi:MAG: hypothetical protein Q7S16_00930 [bacterium]|nr:hypothetical protein [bacterium]
MPQGEENSDWYLMLLKDGHRYHFRYRREDKTALFYALMRYADDERFSVTVKDLAQCTSRILKNLDANAVIELPSSPPATKAA